MDIEHLLVLVATIAAHLTDPLVWLLVLAMLASGYFRVSSWWVIPGALIATGINIIAVWSWWRQIGVAADWPSAVWILVSLLIIGAVAYGIGRLGARLFGRERKADPKG